MLVTHDIDEAVALSKRVVVLSGRPARVKTVHDIEIAEPRRSRRAATAASPATSALCAANSTSRPRSQAVGSDGVMSVITAGTSAAEARKAAAGSRRKRCAFDTTLGRAVLQAGAVVSLLLLWQIGVRVGVDFRLSVRFAVRHLHGVYADGRQRRTAVRHLVHPVRGDPGLRHRHDLRIASPGWRCGIRCSWRGWSSRSSSQSTACRRSRSLPSSFSGSAPDWCPRSRCRYRSRRSLR